MIPPQRGARIKALKIRGRNTMSMYRIRASTELLDLMFGLPKGYSFTPNDGTDGEVVLFIRHDDGKDDYGFTDATICRIKGKDAEVAPC
jgi:hypothetical protein